MIRIWSNSWNFTMPDNAVYLLEILPISNGDMHTVTFETSLCKRILAEFKNEKDAELLVDELSWHLWHRKEFHTDTDECPVEWRNMELEIHITYSENRPIYHSEEI